MKCTTMQRHYFLGCILVVIAACCWGLIGLMGTQLNQAGFSGLEVASLRIALASLVLIVSSPLVWHSLSQFQFKQLPMLSLQSLLGVLMMTLFYFLAVQSIGAALAVALLYTAPVWSVILAHFLLGERITPIGVVLTLVTVSGVAMCLNSAAPMNGTGIVYGLLAGFSYACFGVLGKKAVNNNPPSLVLYSSVLISGLAMLFTPFFHTAVDKMLAGVAPSVWLVAVAIAVIGTLVPYGLYTKALQWMPATRAQVLTIFEPLTAVLLAAVILREPLGWSQYVGIAMILAAALFNALNQPKPNMALSSQQA